MTKNIIPFARAQRSVKEVVEKFYQELDEIEEIVALLRGLTQPTSLIWGEQDRILPPVQGQWMKAHLPRAEFHLLPEVGHAPQEEAPGPVNKIIIDFLRRSLKN